jgi:hypothetical protein
MHFLRRHRTLCLIAVIILGSIAGEWYVGASERHDEVSCEPTGKTVQLDNLPEASGLTLSLRNRGILWSFNDSGDPVIYALDTSGHVRGTVRVANARVKNWEAITSARCASGSCLYIADIGDNKEKRPEITIYRVAEPRPTDTETAPAQQLRARYPDGPHDAEALFIAHDGTLRVITKDKPAFVYRFPEPVESNTVMTLERESTLPMEKVTDAETSPDGEWIGVRSKEEMIFYRNEEFALAEHGTPISLRTLGEPQGEGLAIGADGTVYLASEGKKGQPGSFRTMRCTFPGETAGR